MDDDKDQNHRHAIAKQLKKAQNASSSLQQIGQEITLLFDEGQLKSGGRRPLPPKSSADADLAHGEGGASSIASASSPTTTALGSSASDLGLIVNNPATTTIGNGNVPQAKSLPSFVTINGKKQPRRQVKATSDPAQIRNSKILEARNRLKSVANRLNGKPLPKKVLRPGATRGPKIIKPQSAIETKRNEAKRNLAKKTLQAKRKVVKSVIKNDKVVEKAVNCLEFSKKELGMTKEQRAWKEKMVQARSKKMQANAGDKFAQKFAKQRRAAEERIRKSLETEKMKKEAEMERQKKERLRSMERSREVREAKSKTEINKPSSSQSKKVMATKPQHGPAAVARKDPTTQNKKSSEVGKSTTSTNGTFKNGSSHSTLKHAPSGKVASGNAKKIPYALARALEINAQNKAINQKQAMRPKSALPKTPPRGMDKGGKSLKENLKRNPTNPCKKSSGPTAKNGSARRDTLTHAHSSKVDQKKKISPALARALEVNAQNKAINRKQSMSPAKRENARSLARKDQIIPCKKSSEIGKRTTSTNGTSKHGSAPSDTLTHARSSKVDLVKKIPSALARALEINAQNKAINRQQPPMRPAKRENVRDLISKYGYIPYVDRDMYNPQKAMQRYLPMYYDTKQLQGEFSPKSWVDPYHLNEWNLDKHLPFYDGRPSGEGFHQPPESRFGLQASKARASQRGCDRKCKCCIEQQTLKKNKKASAKEEIKSITNEWWSGVKKIFFFYLFILLLINFLVAAAPPLQIFNLDNLIQFETPSHLPSSVHPS